MAEEVRLLVDLDAKSLAVLPDYKGDPRDDTLLKVELQRPEHHFPDGNPHRGHLMKVEKKHWDHPGTRRAIENQIRESAGHTGLDTEFYAAKDNFQADAMTCWQRHNRNPACSDYKTEAKALRPDTKAERKAMGLPTSTVKTFLCDFCPVKSLVMSAAHDRSGVRN